MQPVAELEKPYVSRVVLSLAGTVLPVAALHGIPEVKRVVHFGEAVC